MQFQPKIDEISKCGNTFVATVRWALYAVALYTLYLSMESLAGLRVHIRICENTRYRRCRSWLANIIDMWLAFIPYIKQTESVLNAQQQTTHTACCISSRKCCRRRARDIIHYTYKYTLCENIFNCIFFTIKERKQHQLSVFWTICLRDHPIATQASATRAIIIAPFHSDKSAQRLRIVSYTKDMCEAVR